MPITTPRISKYLAVFVSRPPDTYPYRPDPQNPTPSQSPEQRLRRIRSTSRRDLILVIKARQGLGHLFNDGVAMRGGPSRAGLANGAEGPRLLPALQYLDSSRQPGSGLLVCELAEKTQRSLCAWFQATDIYTECTGVGVAACTCRDAENTPGHLRGLTREIQRADSAYESLPLLVNEMQRRALHGIPPRPCPQSHLGARTTSGTEEWRAVIRRPFPAITPLSLRYSINQAASLPPSPSPRGPCHRHASES
ncbi:hypothetical protein E2C01_038322 [Portunus trituberculatus]|uniref:Uncharacterized protein n=1 Tax=Portunus trituberculatus TaxID=210409 RepID=A0A5B7FGI0_PORTR|nr:hypothetical protein [Portunus trituberculatus]